MLAECRTLLIGSNNPCKVHAARTAVKRCFPDVKLITHGVQTVSGVPDQPVGDEETLEGALNRINSIHQCLLLHQRGQHQQDQPEPWLQACPSDSLLIAVEGGVLQRGQHDLYCFAWAAVKLAGGGKASTARSAEFLLPRQLSELVLGGMELGEADDLVFGRIKSGQGSGTVGKLTGNAVTRAHYYEQTITMALIPYMNPALYPEYHTVLPL